MLDSLIKNWKEALTEVLASLIGTLGIVFVIAFILSGQIEGGKVLSLRSTGTSTKDKLVYLYFPYLV